jgi:hypothetical protein
VGVIYLGSLGSVLAVVGLGWWVGSRVRLGGGVWVALVVDRYA